MAKKLDDINQKVDEKTGFGTYVAKDLKTTAMILGGTAAGLGLGYGASKSGAISNGYKSFIKWIGRRFKPETSEKFEEFVENISPGVVLPAVGGLIGMSAGTIPNTYEHWREGKKAQLRVEEMAEDVVALREQRNVVVKSLKDQADSIASQNKAIQDILAKGPAGKDQVGRLEQRSQQTPDDLQRS